MTLPWSLQGWRSAQSSAMALRLSAGPVVVMHSQEQHTKGKRILSAETGLGGAGCNSSIEKLCWTRQRWTLLRFSKQQGRCLEHRNYL